MVCEKSVMFLSVQDISKFGDSGEIFLENISFEQNRFQNIAIAGETGSGKSTLLKIIGGLTQPDGGNVFLQGEKVKGPAEKLIAGHPRMAYLTQHHELPIHLRVEQALEYANQLSTAEAEKLYAICKITHLLKRKTNQLSGGEKQRIALARLLTTSPLLLLLDEPFSNLDVLHKNILKTVIADLSTQLGITTILVSHDYLDTLSWADKIIVLQKGKTVQQGAPQEIYSRPASEYVAGLFGQYNLWQKEAASTFAQRFNLKRKEKNIFLRPENILLSDDPNADAGLVKSVLFYGYFCEATIESNGITLLVRTTRMELQKNTTVHFTIDRNKIWQF